VVDRLGILAGHDHLPHEDGGYAVALTPIVLVEGHDEEAIVGHGPLRVAVHMLLQPAIAFLDRAVVHVVVEVGYYK
jgi:hypothetical protein